MLSTRTECTEEADMTIISPIMLSTTTTAANVHMAGVDTPRKVSRRRATPTEWPFRTGWVMVVTSRPSGGQRG